MNEPDANLLSLNTATVRQQWTLPEVIAGCARHGIRGIAPWRDQAAADAYGLVDVMQQLLEANGARTELETALVDLDRNVEVAGALARAGEA